MDKDEFLVLISDKGKAIVEEYIPQFSKKKSFTVTFSEYSSVAYDEPNFYTIQVKSSESKYEYEYSFMHEFFHCVQHEEGFPHIISRIDGYEQLATEISSSILDFNIRSRLEKYEYYNHVEQLQYALKTLYNLFDLIRVSKDNYPTHLENIAYATFFVSAISTNKCDKELLPLLQLVSKVSPETYEIYKLINKFFKMYNYNSKSGIYKIYKKFLKHLDLNEYLTMTN